MVEKRFGVHTGAYWKRVACRVPVGAILWLIALAFPFFGVINDVLGAFTTTFEARDCCCHGAVCWQGGAVWGCLALADERSRAAVTAAAAP